MYLLLKIITSLSLAILPVAVFYRDWKHHDRRTSTHNKLTRGIFFLWAVSSLAAVGLVWHETYESNTLTAKIDDLVTGKNELLKQVSVYKTDLTAKDAKIKELSEKTDKASRGITDTFDFNGSRRDNRPGVFNLTTDTPEAKIFQQLVQLERNHDYAAIISICEKEVKETSEWLTPYLFLGVSYLNIGDKAKGVEYLTYVKDHAYGNPEYAHAEELLRQVR
jgi:hypothetical protein